MSLLEDLQKLKSEGEKAIEKATRLDQLEKIRITLLGRKGKLTALIKKVSSLPLEERPKAGKVANEIKDFFEKGLGKRKKEIEEAALKKKLKEEVVDLSLPGKLPLVGRPHILNRVIDEITEIFIGLGYEVAEGPEVELDYYNFLALNTPVDHPARSLQDTFYITEGISFGEGLSNQEIKEISSKIALLRTHTSPIQIRVMEKRKPPLFIIAPGRCFRHDVPDATHSPQFHQVEGFAVDQKITLGDLKGTLEVFVKEMFGQERKIRFRPSFFPFTEPSAEVDVSCIICDGRGCRICKESGWLEILGAGMIDPNVFKEVGYDPESVTGFAFGMGVERIAMLKYGINDIRLFFENDLRFLQQF